MFPETMFSGTYVSWFQYSPAGPTYLPWYLFPFVFTSIVINSIIGQHLPLRGLGYGLGLVLGLSSGFELGLRMTCLTRICKEMINHNPNPLNDCYANAG